jgi:hypothetical protein
MSEEEARSALEAALASHERVLSMTAELEDERAIRDRRIQETADQGMRPRLIHRAFRERFGNEGLSETSVYRILGTYDAEAL